MKRYWITIIGLGLLLGPTILLLQTGPGRAAGQEQTETNRSMRTISVSGAGQAEARPDVAVIRLGVETQAEEANTALTQNNQQMQNLMAALQEDGLAAEDIQTQTVQLRPRYQEPEPGSQPELAGYTATNIVEVRVRNLAELGPLLDRAVQAGGNRVEGIRFEVSDPGQLLEQAREAAWNDAQAKADQLVELAGTELDEVWSIREFSNAPRPVRSEMMQESIAAAPIEPGTQTIEVRLEVTWLLP